MYYPAFPFCLIEGQDRKRDLLLEKRKEMLLKYIQFGSSKTSNENRAGDGTLVKIINQAVKNRDC